MPNITIVGKPLSKELHRSLIAPAIFALETANVMRPLKQQCLLAKESAEQLTSASRTPSFVLGCFLSQQRAE